MRNIPLAAAGAALLLPTAASAHGWGHNGYRGGSEVRQEQRECERELRRADSRREYRRELRECRREIREARRDDRRDYRYDRRAYRQPYGYYGNQGRRYWDGYTWRYRY